MSVRVCKYLFELLDDVGGGAEGGEGEERRGEGRAASKDRSFGGARPERAAAFESMTWAARTVIEDDDDDDDNDGGTELS